MGSLQVHASYMTVCRGGGLQHVAALEHLIVLCLLQADARRRVAADSSSVSKAQRGGHRICHAAEDERVDLVELCVPVSRWPLLFWCNILGRYAIAEPSSLHEKDR